MSDSVLRETEVSTEVVYDGVLLRVRRDEVRLPDGGTSRREWIEHPGASAVVPLFDDGSTLLLRQFRYGPRREFLEVPAGKIDEPGENPAEVARRELLEEAGLQTRRLTALGPTYPCIGYSDEVIHLFLAEDLVEGQAETDDDEFVIPVRMSFEQAVALARAGNVEDAKTCLALLRAAAHLASKASGCKE